MEKSGMNDFQTAMVRLDCALTGNPAARVEQQMHHRPASVLEWWERGREWYLSDGGYSRVWLGEDGHLFLGGNSLDTVKAAWPNCTALIAPIEAMVEQAFREAGYR